MLQSHPDMLPFIMSSMLNETYQWKFRSYFFLAFVTLAQWLYRLDEANTVLMPDQSEHESDDQVAEFTSAIQAESTVVMEQSQQGSSSSAPSADSQTTPGKLFFQQLRTLTDQVVPRLHFMFFSPFGADIQSLLYFFDWTSSDPFIVQVWVTFDHF